MAERVKVWECTGCGRIEGHRPCIGICQDRPTELVQAADYEQALAEAELATRRAEAALGLLRQLALASPRAGEWERSYRALQARAQALLASGI
jgi:hypothetical protein